MFTGSRFGSAMREPMFFPTDVQSYSAGSGQNQLTLENATFYKTALLDRLLPDLHYMKYGEKKPIPKRSGATAQWRRFNSLAVVTTALTEGVTPDGVNLSMGSVTATVKDYGNYTKISGYLDMVGIDPVITETSEIMGENAAESMDSIVRDIITAGTNVVYAGNKLSRATVAATDVITAADILKVRTIMKRNKVREIKLPDGSMGYLMFIHPDVAADLMKTQEWKDQNTYVSTDNRKAGVVGKLYGIYFLESVNNTVLTDAGATGAEVYLNVCIGKGAYGVPDVDGSGSPDILVKPAGSAGTADPLDQFNTVGWKSTFTAVRLQELAIIRYESSATAI
ncbi:N4-gp56 family major capsid protein [Paenibacillus sp. LHD-117]|uniref:N4-gp56 family major capsid protein n=1 Tax=Paenibacillus sp. LHD-117 TaxID=3071412 RepID=UPI0027E06CAA|nr:N4-gp56 family major capsid protein [Paenibacillus sp. LHD-117]MDQ6418677.1 N4-gp56 family major capsid protein [Paenibacillus sp. LHD-117]